MINNRSNIKIATIVLLLVGWLATSKGSPAVAEKAEIDGPLSAGIAQNKVCDFEPVDYSTDLVPATPLKLPKVAGTGVFGLTRGRQTRYIWLEKNSSSLELKVTGGLITH